MDHTQCGRQPTRLFNHWNTFDGGRNERSKTIVETTDTSYLKGAYSNHVYSFDDELPPVHISTGIGGAY